MLVEVGFRPLADLLRGLVLELLLQRVDLRHELLALVEGMRALGENSCSLLLFERLALLGELCFRSLARSLKGCELGRESRRSGRPLLLARACHGVGPRPLALLPERPFSLGEPLALLLRDPAADLGELLVGDRLLAPGTALAPGVCGG